MLTTILLLTICIHGGKSIQLCGDYGTNNLSTISIQWTICQQSVYIVTERIGCFLHVHCGNIQQTDLIVVLAFTDNLNIYNIPVIHTIVLTQYSKSNMNNRNKKIKTLVLVSWCWEYIRLGVLNFWPGEMWPNWQLYSLLWV